MQLTFFNWLLALLPVVVVLVLMLGFHWSGSRAGAAAWFVTIAIAVARFGAGAQLLAYTQVKAVLLTLDVLYIIWTALLLYVLLRFQAWSSRWAHSFARLLTLLRAALWQRRDLAQLLRRYGTADGPGAAAFPPAQSWLPGFAR